MTHNFRHIASILHVSAKRKKKRAELTAYAFECISFVLLEERNKLYET